MITFFTWLALFVAAAGLAGAYFDFISPTIGASLSLIGLSLLAFLFFFTLVSFVKNGAKETNWITLLLGLASLSSFAGIGYFHFKHPLKDITTDVRNPPRFLFPIYPFRVAKGGEYLDKSLQLNRDFDQKNSATQLLNYPGFEGLPVKAPPKDSYAEAVKVLREQMPELRFLMDDSNNFHAEMETVWSPFNFIDDVVLEVRSDPGTPFDSRIELRSRTRTSLSDGDFGVNIFRLREIKVRLLLAMRALEDRTLAQRTAWETKKESPPVAKPDPARTGQP